MNYIDYQEKNMELIHAYQNGDQEALGEILKLNDGLVKKVATGYKQKADLTALYDFEDLVQIGMMGIIKAIEKYDESVGTKFSTYAVYWIKQAITRFIHNADGAMRLPAHSQDIYYEMSRFIDLFQNIYHRRPSIEEIINHFPDNTESLIKNIVTIQSHIRKIASAMLSFCSCGYFAL